MVVRLDLEDDVELVVEAHDAGVVLEHAHAPVVVRPPLADLLRGGEDRLLEHVLEAAARRHVVAVGDPPGERLVAAVLAPGLGERLQLDVGRVAVQLAEVGLDRLHLGQLQVELALAAEPHERLVVQLADRHVPQFELVRRADLEPFKRQRTDDDLLDGVVGQQPIADAA